MQGRAVGNVVGDTVVVVDGVVVEGGAVKDSRAQSVGRTDVAVLVKVVSLHLHANAQDRVVSISYGFQRFTSMSRGFSRLVMSMLICRRSSSGSPRVGKLKYSLMQWAKCSPSVTTMFFVRRLYRSFPAPVR